MGIGHGCTFVATVFLASPEWGPNAAVRPSGTGGTPSHAGSASPSALALLPRRSKPRISRGSTPLQPDSRRNDSAVFSSEDGNSSRGVAAAAAAFFASGRPRLERVIFSSGAGDQAAPPAFAAVQPWPSEAPEPAALPRRSSGGGRALRRISQSVPSESASRKEEVPVRRVSSSISPRTNGLDEALPSEKAQAAPPPTVYVPRALVAEDDHLCLRCWMSHASASASRGLLVLQAIIPEGVFSRS